MFVIAGWNKDKHNCMSRENSLSSQPSGKPIVLGGTIAFNFSKKGILFISINFNVTDIPIISMSKWMYGKLSPLHIIKIYPVNIKK